MDSMVAGFRGMKPTLTTYCPCSVPILGLSPDRVMVQDSKEQSLKSNLQTMTHVYRKPVILQIPFNGISGDQLYAGASIKSGQKTLCFRLALLEIQEKFMTIYTLDTRHIRLKCLSWPWTSGMDVLWIPERFKTWAGQELAAAWCRPSCWPPLMDSVAYVLHLQPPLREMNRGDVC